ncbi:MAG TPA: isochorismatase family protein [Methylomirabilota bacterium]|nr:isochorismatase family protein [Methylomirabilota bacterium]
MPAILVGPDDVHVSSKKSLAGIDTDTCVYSTAFSTANRGYRTVVISDCVASMRGKDHHWMALELMGRTIAWVLTLEQFKGKVRAGSS